MKPTCFIGHSGIAPANTSHILYFDGVDHRDKYNEFYEELVRVKDIATLPLADKAQKLLVKHIREDVGQPLAAEWFEEHWTGPFGRYRLAHAGYTWGNNTTWALRLTGVT